MTPLESLNAAEPEEAAAVLRRCCGATRWVETMLRARPFKDATHLFAEADRAWAKAGETDWLEAFRHHPRIGDVDNLRARFRNTATWSEQEQKGVDAASEDVLLALAQGNQFYEQKFGFIFIVCATGKSAKEMLDLLNARLPNTVNMELRTAALEQAKITRIRLEKLLSP